MAQNYAASVQGVAIRACRLDANGTPTGGLTGAYVMNSFMSVAFTPEYEEGERITEKTAAGQVCVDYKSPDTLQRVTLELSICNPDVEFTEIISGGTLLTSAAGTASTVSAASVVGATTITTAASLGSPGTYTIGAGASLETVQVSAVAGTTATLAAAATKAHAIGETVAPVGQNVGYAAPEIGVDSNPNGCGLEVWSYAVQNTRRASVLPFFQWVFPLVQLKPTGDRTFENGLMANVFSGVGVGNTAFGSGPAGAGAATAWPYPAVSGRPYAYSRVANAPTGMTGYSTVTA